MFDNTLIFDLLDVKVGSLSVTNIHKDRWGHTITFDFMYTYPPEEKPFKLIFKNCRSCEWYVLRALDNMPKGKNIHVITHDLGQPNYQATARIVTVVVEVIISYGEVVVEKDW